ncbi:hypothetical protein MNEG_16672 [Monoraphidium neglectum]|jgi:hypothetical protein|uniref:Uncharacterized protein n=1 Tax=Monoraphidium neglectum TaxID=145388 RepID=A0A0D2ITD4_9CHLO|nr:hypothetical protein MNEG_16672 [Monoraphidium neglectum]KIY91292.1 hypothetical protein MNEG_16672 [Monoraphidium neglectum]|eukprot:XP_013890312.1 hypothetical protein MNEG_16672 [Monoraphidium neglectum]
MPFGPIVQAGLLAGVILQVIRVMKPAAIGAEAPQQQRPGSIASRAAAYSAAAAPGPGPARGPPPHDGPGGAPAPASAASLPPSAVQLELEELRASFSRGGQMGPSAWVKRERKYKQDIEKYEHTVGMLRQRIAKLEAELSLYRESGGNPPLEEQIQVRAPRRDATRALTPRVHAPWKACPREIHISFLPAPPPASRSCS